MRPSPTMTAALAMTALALVVPPANAVVIPPEPQVGDLIDAERDVAVAPPALPRRPAAAEPLSLDLRWPGGAKVAAATADGELVVRYDKRVDDAAAQAFAAAAGERLARFDWGYDALVIRTRPDMVLSAETLPDGVRVTFTPVAAPLAGVVPGSAATLALVGAQADAAAGYPGRSRRRLAMLAAAAPDDRTLQQALAEAEIAADRVADGARRYRLLGDAPGSAIDPRLLDRARRVAGARVESTASLRDGRGLDQSEITLRGSTPVRPDLAIETGIRAVHTDATEVVVPAGRKFDWERTVGVFEVGAAYRPAPAIRLRGLVAGLMDGGVVGGAVAIVAGDPELQGTARVAWHLPDFATAEGALLGGFLNRIALGGFVRPVPGVGIRAEAGINRYGLKGDGVLAHSTTVEGSAEWLVRRQRPTLALVYRFDAEYVGWHGIRPIGQSALPLLDRENHTGELVGIQPIGSRFTLTAAAGWTADRFGGNGPSASAGLRYVGDGGWEASALAGVSSITRPDQRDRQIYGRVALIKRFGRGT